MSLNKAMVIGNLGRDPELRYSQKQTPICTLSVASTESQKNQAGEWADHTEWHRVVVFGKQADNCNKYLSKGSQVFVDGKIRTNKWQDKNGIDRYTTEIIANNVKFLGSRAGSGAKSYNQEESYGNSKPAAAPDTSVLDNFPSADQLGASPAGNNIQDDDIPF